MEKNEEKNGPEKKSQVGRFQVSLWRTKKVLAARNDFEPEREFVARRACIQYSRLNQVAPPGGAWIETPIWNIGDRNRDRGRKEIGFRLWTNGLDFRL